MRKVVITGMGCVTPLGDNVGDFYKAIRDGECGIDKISLFDVTDYPVKIAGEVKNFDVTKRVDKRRARSMARFTQFATYAAAEAIEMAKLEVPETNNIGVYLGNGIGGFEIAELNLEKLFQRGPRAISPLTIPLLIGNEAAGNISILNNLQGPSHTIQTACASGTDAIGAAFLAIKSGLIDTAVTGGCEASITQLALAGFARLHALSASHNEDPKTASCPFDKNRDGFTMGEGAGILVLESEESAKKRNAKILGEIVGYGSSCDAFHITAPNPEGTGAAIAMQRAIEMSGLNIKDIDYINAHGTSTPANDVMETKAIKLAFGDYAKDVKISSTKSMTSHLVGAAGAVEAIVCVKSIEEGYYPATINYETPDEECDLNYIPNKGFEANMDYALSQSLGFGGHNGALIFGKYKG